MKIQGTPEEMEQAKNWWADQKKRSDEEYKEAKKKDPNAKKDTSLVSPENKERTNRDVRLNLLHHHLLCLLMMMAVIGHIQALERYLIDLRKEMV